MTSITFGGGPNIEARRSFSNLKTGSQVPGYGGHIHKLKFNNGRTYGDLTHLLYDKSTDGAKYNDDFTKVNSDLFSKSNLKNQLPKSTGGSKLTESMVPGYTGYVPSRKFHFSNTYRAECDECIDDMLTSRHQISSKKNDIMDNVYKNKKLTNISADRELKNELDNFKNSNTPLIGDKRNTFEAPMPGYTGYVPRIIPTDIGLGSTYHNSTLKGLDDFRRSLKTNPLTDFGNASQVASSEDFSSSKRVFVPPGMIPKYTGYVHGRKFHFGKTYGDTTRELPVCIHRSKSFGEHLNENPPVTAIC